MYEKFTDRARQLMKTANTIAQELYHEHIDTEHVLLASIRLKDGAAELLVEMAIKLEELEGRIRSSIVQRGEIITMGRLPQTEATKRVVEYALEESRNLRHGYIEERHILLGLIREDQGAAGKVLKEMGITLAIARDRFLLSLPVSMNGVKQELELLAEELGLPPNTHSLLLAVRTARRDCAFVASLRNVVASRTV